MRTLAMLTTAICLMGANGSNAASSPGAKQVAGALTGDAGHAASANPVCKLFTPAEIGKFAGQAVKSPINAAAGTACQWNYESGAGNVQVQIVRASDHEPPSHAPGFHKLHGVGSEGFVLPDVGGWHAGAIQGKESINVVIGGQGGNQDSATAFLKEAMKRRQP